MSEVQSGPTDQGRAKSQAVDNEMGNGHEQRPAKDNAKETTGLLGLLKKKLLGDPSTSADPDATSNATTTCPPSVPTTNIEPPSATTSTPSKTIPRSTSPGPQPHMTPPSTSTYFPTTSSPPAHPHSISAAASPSRYARSSSPRLASPAASLIFERNVQEAPLPDDLQAAIPHHIHTEDYIPPTLEASTNVITDARIKPDEVEIVMHSAHQPASSHVGHTEAGPGMGSSALSPLSLGNSHGDAPAPGLSPASAKASESTTSVDELGSNHYGSIDSSDVRRLSFISFADVVQGEHAHDNGSLPPKDPFLPLTANQSPSPVRSAASSRDPADFGLSPPTSGTPSMKGVELGSTGKQQQSFGSFPGSPGSLATQSPNASGSELHVETMSQALRKTRSGDLTAPANPASPI